MSRTTALLLAKAAFSAALVALIVRTLDVGAVLDRLRGADLRYVALGYGVLLVVVTLSSWRWFVLANGLLDAGQAFRYTWIGAFFGHVLPGSISGDIAKGVAIALKHPETRGLTLPASIVVDKLVGFVVLVALFAIAGAALFAMGAATTPAMRQGIAALFAVSLAGVGGLAAGLWIVARGHADRLLAHPRIAGTRPCALARQVVDSLRQYGRSPALLGKGVAISFLIHLCNVGGLWASLRAVGVDPPGLLPLVAYPILSVAVMLPITVAGIGVREVVMIGVFALFGLGREAAVAQSWLSIVMTVPIIVLGSSVQLMELFGRRRVRSPEGRGAPE